MSTHGYNDSMWVLKLLAILLFSLPSSDGESGIFAPGDTRIISYSTTLCQSLRLRGNSSEYPATLYLLRNMPKLTLQKSYSRHLNTTSETTHSQFYLNTGSFFSMQYCLEPPVNHSISFSFGVYEQREIQHLTIDNSCSKGSKAYDFKIESPDEYYYWIRNHGIPPAVPDIAMQFVCTYYNATRSEIVENCTAFGTSSCSVDVPLESDYTAMINVSSWGSNDVATLHIEWYCVPRLWLYAVIVCGSLITCTSMTTVTFICCWRQLKRKRKNWAQYAPLKPVSPQIPVNNSINSLSHGHGYRATFGYLSPNRADKTMLLRPPRQEVLDPAPVRKEGSMFFSSESAVIAGAAALL